jgi:hypothetical protein
LLATICPSEWLKPIPNPWSRNPSRAAPSTIQNGAEPGRPVRLDPPFCPCEMGNQARLPCYQAVATTLILPRRNENSTTRALWPVLPCTCHFARAKCQVHRQAKTVPSLVVRHLACATGYLLWQGAVGAADEPFGVPIGGASPNSRPSAPCEVACNLCVGASRVFGNYSPLGLDAIPSERVEACSIGYVGILFY